MTLLEGVHSTELCGNEPEVGQTFTSNEKGVFKHVKRDQKHFFSP